MILEASTDSTDSILVIRIFRRKNILIKMQGQRSKSNPFSEIFEFEHEALSSNLDLNQPLFQNSTPILLQIQNISPYPISSGSSSTPTGNVAGLESTGLINWTSVGPRFNLHAENLNSHNEIQFQNDWTSPLITSSTGGSQATVEWQTQQINMLSSENLDIDVNIDHVENVQPFSLVSDLNGFPQNNVVNTHVSGSDFISQPPNLGTVQHRHYPGSFGLSGGHESSSRIIHDFQDNDGNQQELLLGGICPLRKRRFNELVAGQSSTSASFSNMIRDVNIPQEDVSTRIGIATRVPSSTPTISPQGNVLILEDNVDSTRGNQEGFMRNTRMRINLLVPSDSSTPSIFPQGSVLTHATNWSVYQSSAPSILSNHLPESALFGGLANSLSQPNLSTFPALSSSTFPISRGEASTSMVGSACPLPVTTGDGSVVEDPNMWMRYFDRVHLRPAIHPALNNRDWEQDLVNGGLSNRVTSVSGHTSPAVHDQSGFAAYRHNLWPGVSSRFRQLSDSTEPRGQSVNLPPHLGNSSASPEVGRVPAHVHLTSFMTVPPIFPGLQNEGVLHRRDRDPSEEVLESEPQNSQQSELSGSDDELSGSDDEFNDQHRELRLDVDNMSYEELLALEESIGNVNTGLNKEILKSLKQHKYVFVRSKTSSQDVPCCICQEEYVEGEDVAQLDCSHDFHVACIKEWLVMKNSCPLCKRTAVKSE